MRRWMGMVAGVFLLLGALGGCRSGPNPDRGTPPGAPRATATLSGSVAPSPPATATPTRAFTGFTPPYPPPGSCAVAPWSGHERRRTFPAFWLDGDGLAAGNPVGALLYEGGQKIQWQAAPGGGETIAIDGARQDAPAPPATARAVPLDAGVWSSETTFPAPGCWRLRATDQLHRLDLVVYVYPAACRPAALRDVAPTPSRGDCLPPAP